MRRLVLLFVVACSSAPAKPTPAPRPASCPTPDRSADAVMARRAVIGKSVGKGREYVWKLDAPTDLDAVRATCAEIDDEVRFLCYEGLGQGYGTAIAKQLPRDRAPAALREAVGQLATIDAASSVIQCRGLGAGLHAGGVTAAELPAATTGLDAKCRDLIVDGFATRTYLGRIKTPQATQADLETISIDDVCSGLEPRWCAFGSGRGMAHLFAAESATAAVGCKGAQRGGCLAGIAYVTTYLYEPADLAHSVKRIDDFTGADRASYTAGVASALRWAKRHDTQRFAERLACVPVADRPRVEKILATAEACNAYDFADACNWEEAAQ